MNLNSLIDTIKRSIVTGTSADVEIHDKSLLSGVLAEDDGDGRPFYRSVFSQWKFDSADRFPMLMAAFRTLWSLFVAVVSLFYMMASVVMLLFTGKWKDRSRSPRMNAVIFLSVVIGFVVMAVLIVSFFFKNVLLFSPHNHVNDAGALVMKQPCGKEHYVFLFNTAECWANTGIDVMAGDKLQISASGAYYGRVQDLALCAKRNVELPFAWNNPSRKVSAVYSNHMDAMNKASGLCMYRGEGARFGSLLCQIQPDALPCVYEDSGVYMEQLDMDAEEGVYASVDVERSGKLYVAVNDIYLSDRVKSELKKSAGYKEIFLGDSTFSDEQIDMLKENAWFNDNFGEILMNIVVIRSNPGDSSIFPYGIMPRFYRMIDDWTSNDWRGLLVSLSYIVAFLAADFTVGYVIRSRRRDDGGMDEGI